jgi:hypothetical protein
MTDGKFKILSFRSKDPQFKTDPGVIPPEEIREKSGIRVVQTAFQHNDMCDTGPDGTKASLQGMLDKFLDDDSPLRPIETKAPPAMTDPGPVAPAGQELTTEASHASIEAITSAVRRTGVSITQYHARTIRWASHWSASKPRVGLQLSGSSNRVLSTDSAGMSLCCRATHSICLRASPDETLGHHLPNALNNVQTRADVRAPGKRHASSRKGWIGWKAARLLP